MSLFKRSSNIWIVLIFLAVFISLSPANATHTTEIKATYQQYGDFSHALGDDVTFVNNSVSIFATLHVDGGKPQWYRYLNIDVYDSSGNKIYHDRCCTWRIGEAYFYPDFNLRKPGIYKIVLSYEGNSKDDYSPAEKITTVTLK